MSGRAGIAPAQLTPRSTAGRGKLRPAVGRAARLLVEHHATAGLRSSVCERAPLFVSKHRGPPLQSRGLAAGPGRQPSAAVLGLGGRPSARLPSPSGCPDSPGCQRKAGKSLNTRLCSALSPFLLFLLCTLQQRGGCCWTFYLRG